MQFNTTSHEVCKVGEYTFRATRIGSPKHIQLLFNGKAVGTLSTDRLQSGWSRIRLFKIDSEHQSRGLGTLFLQVAFALMNSGELGFTGSADEIKVVQATKLLKKFNGEIKDVDYYIPKNGY